MWRHFAWHRFVTRVRNSNPEPQSSHQIILTLSESYYQILLHSFFRIYKDQYWYFRRTTIKLYQPLESSHQTMQAFSESYYETMVNTFFRLYIKQYWYFQNYYKIILYTFSEFTSNNKFTESYYQTIIHFFQTSYQTILTISARFSIKQCCTLFQSFTEITKKYWLSQNLRQRILIFSLSYYQTIVKNLFRVHPKQYWHFPRVFCKQTTK